MFVFKALADQKFHLSLTAQLLIKCQIWILRRARFISYSSWIMSRHPLSFIPNGSFIYINCKINARNQVILKWKQIVKENLFPYSKLRKSVRIVHWDIWKMLSVPKSIREAINYALIFTFPNKSAKGNFFPRCFVLFHMRNLQPQVKRCKILHNLKLKKSFTYVFLLFFPSKL